MSQTAIIAIILVGFPILFLGMWLGILGFFSAVAWKPMIEHHSSPTTTPAAAQRLSGQSMRVQAFPLPINYSYCLDAWTDADRVCIRPNLLFRPFHNLLCIRFDEMSEVEPKRGIGLKRVEVTLPWRRRPVIFYGALGDAVYQGWSRRHGQGGADG